MSSWSPLHHASPFVASHSPCRVPLVTRRPRHASTHRHTSPWSRPPRHPCRVASRFPHSQPSLQLDDSPSLPSLWESGTHPLSCLALGRDTTSPHVLFWDVLFHTSRSTPLPFFFYGSFFFFLFFFFFSFFADRSPSLTGAQGPLSLANASRGSTFFSNPRARRSCHLVRPFTFYLFPADPSLSLTGSLGPPSFYIC